MAVSLPSYQLSESATYPSNADSFSLIKITHNAKKTLIHEKKKKKCTVRVFVFFFPIRKCWLCVILVHCVVYIA